MSRTTISRLFVAAIASLVVGLVIGIGAVVAALLGGAVVLGGPSFVTLQTGPLASALAALVVACLVITASTVAAAASWVGALLNTWRLDDKTWFVALLTLGLVSLGWVAMVAYVVAGPEGGRGLPTTHDAPGGTVA
jgi:hypothetical protein